MDTKWRAPALVGGSVLPQRVQLIKVSGCLANGNGVGNCHSELLDRS